MRRTGVRDRHVASQIIDRTIDGHCDCMFPINTYGWDLVDIAALVAPRPCLIASADCDRIFNVARIREFHARLKRVYDMAGVRDKLGWSKRAEGIPTLNALEPPFFSWFLKHLAGLEIPPSQVGDVDPENDEPEDLLQVFTSGPPPDEVTTTIQDTFIKLAEPPVITDIASLSRHRNAVIAALREKTFAHFPLNACQLDLRVEFKWDLEDRHGVSFSFVAEDDYRLWANLIIRNGVSDAGPAMVMLQNAGDKYSKTGVFRDALPDWAEANVEVRGSGRTNWGQELQWHLRCAAVLTGRTIASMRVWDTLRALAAVRELPQVDAGRIALAGSGEMAAVVLYAALLDGKISAIILHNPPATQDVPGNRDGIGYANEMLNCLRITDLPQVAGLLFPAELVFLGPRPNSYLWAEDLFLQLGGRVCHVNPQSIG